MAKEIKIDKSLIAEKALEASKKSKPVKAPKPPKPLKSLFYVSMSRRFLRRVFSHPVILLSCIAGAFGIINFIETNGSPEAAAIQDNKITG